MYHFMNQKHFFRYTEYMKDFLRRNEDRGLDAHDLIRKEEILAHDYERMHNKRSAFLQTLFQAVIWIAIFWVVLRLLKKL